MPGARPTTPTSNLPEAKPKPRKNPWRKRSSKPQEAEKSLVEDIVAQTPGGLTTGQQHALAVVLRRTRESVKTMVAEAALNLAERSDRYADIHMKATETALANGDAKSLEVAARAAQWAMENINVDGTQVVEKAPDKPHGPMINIGIKLGGMNDRPVEAEIIEAKVDA